MKQEFIEAAVASRQTLNAVLEGLDETALTEIPVEGTWTAKDVLGHIAATDAAILRATRHARRGETILWGWEGAADVDSFNEAEAALRRPLTLGAVLAELRETRQQLLDELAACPGDLGPFGPDSWDLEKSQIGWLASHEVEHAEALKKLRDS